MIDYIRSEGVGPTTELNLIAMKPNVKADIDWVVEFANKTGSIDVKPKDLDRLIKLLQEYKDTIEG